MDAFNDNEGVQALVQVSFQPGIRVHNKFLVEINASQTTSNNEKGVWRIQYLEELDWLLTQGYSWRQQNESGDLTIYLFFFIYLFFLFIYLFIYY